VENPAFWNQKVKEALHVAKKLQPIQTSAKNLIIFLEDGECSRDGHPKVLVFQVSKATDVSWKAWQLRPGQVLFLQGWWCSR
jgi:hypothetical protein